MPDGKAVILAEAGRWDTQAWRNAQADGAANHLSQKDNIAFGRLYEVVGREKALSDQLTVGLSELNALYLPRRPDPASRAEYLRVIGRVRDALSRSMIYTPEILERAEKLGVAKPRLEEFGPEVTLDQAFCRQFHDGKTDLFYEIPKAVMEKPFPLPSE